MLAISDRTPRCASGRAGLARGFAVGLSCRRQELQGLAFLGDKLDKGRAFVIIARFRQEPLKALDVGLTQGAQKLGGVGIDGTQQSLKSLSAGLRRRNRFKPR